MDSIRPLRVFHLPVDIRWILENTIKGQEELGIETRTLMTSSRGIRNRERFEVSQLPLRQAQGFLKGYPRFATSFLKFWSRYWTCLQWADVVHWQYSNRLAVPGSFGEGLDFKLLRASGKPAIVQFHGGDFRNSALWCETNPWWHEAYEPSFMENLDKNAAETQKSFAEADFVFAMGQGMLSSVALENSDRMCLLERMVDMSEIEETKKNIERHTTDKLRICHTPSHPTAKGTHYIVKAIHELQQNYDFDFDLIENVEHHEALSRTAAADIMVEQIINGDYGLAAVEGMGLGCAVVSNVNTALRQQYPKTLPIASADPDTLYQVLERLIINEGERKDLSCKGPIYARDEHSIKALTPDVLKAYRFAAERKGCMNTVALIEQYLH